MKHLKIAVLALVLVMGLNVTNAQDKNNPWALSVGINAVDIRTPDDFSGVLKDYINGEVEDLNMIPSISRITLSRYLKKGFSLQLAGSINEIKKGFNYSEGDTKTEDLFLAIDAKVKYDLNNLFGQTGWFDPFVLLGGGYTKIGDGNDVNLGTGLGFNTWLGENIGLSFQSDYNHGFRSTARDYFQHSLGLVIRFGGLDTDGDGVYDQFDACPEVFGLEEFKGCPDSDNDGVIDSKDDCPNTAGLAALNGCPDTDGDGIVDKEDACPIVKGTKANNGCPDTDGDGLVDKDDACPTVAGPTENKGCPWPDTDGDGVLDKDDSCVNEAGPASNNGCPKITQDEVVKLEELFKTVYFETGKDIFKEETPSRIEEAAKIIVKYPTAKFLISGHADSVGSKVSNQDLSQRRADAVKNYLVSKGVSSSNLTAKGFGEDMPVASNNTRSGREQNRRVEIKEIK